MIMISQQLTPGRVINGFEIIKVEPIPELRSEAVLFNHQKTGARLVHLYNEDPDNLFSIAFRTPVSDNTGVPHILEHSVLGGSKKFPIKDPFQELLKGSLQTFLNALTYPDKTVYPVSSQVEKDFYNLVDVYCDAVFNPLLTDTTFFQEGWHYDITDPEGPIDIKGIVYNEMKGVFSDFSSHVHRKTMSALLPDTTYTYESGGEPESITDLTIDQWREFHKRFYHPSNSFIFLYGNMPSEKTLKFLQENYLGGYEALPVNSTIQEQPLWKSPQQIEIEAPAPEEDDGTATVAICWLFGNSFDPVDYLSGIIISRYLLGTQSSPLRRALIDSGLGEDLDDISGFDSEIIHGVFAAGLRKTRPEHARKITDLVMDTLKKQVDQGLDKDILEGAVRQTEFRLREITGGHFPYNLRLADRCYRSWLYDKDPLTHLTFEKNLAKIKSDPAGQAEFFGNKIRTMLLENTHRLSAIIKASSAKGKELEQQTRTHVEELTRGFDERDRKKYHDLTTKLIEQQKKPPSPEGLAKLPHLNKNDLPRENKIVPVEQIELSTVPVYMHPQFTAGIVYVDIGFDYSHIDEALLPFLPLYSELLTHCGAGGLNYEAMATRVSLATGGISSSVLCQTKAQSTTDLSLRFFLHGKALVAKSDDMMGVFSDIFTTPDLTDKKLLRDLLYESRNDFNASIISAGHIYAMTNASASLCRSEWINERIDGIFQLRFLNSLVREENIDALAEKVQALHSALISQDTCCISVTADDPSRHTAQLESLIGRLPTGVPQSPKPVATAEPVTARKGIEISASVNFVAQAWQLQSITPEEAGLLSLLSRNLSTGFLWDKIRVEGGAYGGMSAFSPVHPVFTCGSYRDPNVSKTLNNFIEGLKQAAEGIEEQSVDQSIIGTIGKIDKPKSPHSRGFGETIALLGGRTREYRGALREAILSATPGNIKAIAQKILDQENTAITVLGNTASFTAAESEGVSLMCEPLLPSGMAVKK
ncbi:MAG: hypothetical protein GF401_03040 [Chitinivibrionales bacterium]|nr:hypothetical protein [Chitinivibrionales bacterium]